MIIKVSSLIFIFWLNGKLFVTQLCILLLAFIETSFASGTVFGRTVVTANPLCQ